MTDVVSPIIPVGSYIPPYMPLSNITPFTYRDGLTYLEVLECLRAYVNTTLVDFVNTNFGILGDEFSSEVNTLIEAVNTQLDAQTATVNTAIADDKTYVDAQIATMQTSVNDAVQEVIASSITVQDPVAAALLNDVASATRAALDSLFITERGMIYNIAAGATADQVQTIFTNAVSGSTIRFSPGTYSTPVNGLVLTNDNITIDSINAVIQSSNWGTPAFDLLDRNNITLKLGTVQYTGVRGALSGNFRGSTNYVGTAAVWANGSSIRVESLHSIGYVCGVFFSSWDGNILNGKYNSNNYVNMEVEQYNFGLLFTAQNDLIINYIYAHDDLDDSNGLNPCHAIYGSSTTNVRDSGVVVNSAKTERNQHGHAYQFKYSDKLTVKNVTADDSTGLFSIIDCHDMTVTNFRSTNDHMFGTLGSFSLQSTDLVSQRPKVSEGYIQSVVGITVRPFLIISQDGDYRNITIDVNFASVSDTNPAYDLRGDGNYLTNLRVIGRGVPTDGIMVGGAPVTQSAKIDTINFINVRNCINIFDGNGIRVSVDDNMQQYTNKLVLSANGKDYSINNVIPLSLSTIGENSILNTLVKDTPVHPTANTGIQIKVRPSRDISVTNLYWFSVVNSGNYDIAIYNDSSNVKLWSKGSNVWPAPGLITEAVPNIILRAGRVYRITFAADNAIGSYRGVSAVTTGLDMKLDTTLVATRVAAIFPLPDPLVAGGTSSAIIPLIIAAGTKP